MKPILLRLHRWTTLLFSLPLVIVIVTGLILSFEPLMQHIGGQSLALPAAQVDALLQQHDPEGKARGLVLRAYEKRLVIQGVGEDGAKEIDLATGLEADEDELMLSDVFSTARSLHEHLLFDQRWLVTATTFAMIALIVLGIFMGWPRLRNTVSGWHQGVSWLLLPAVILSPVTGLMIVFGITLQAPVASDRSAAPPLRMAVQMLAKDEAGNPRDLSQLIWLRQRGGRLLARLQEQGRFETYQLSAAGPKRLPLNWPRGLHEGNAFGLWTVALVLATSLAMMGLMVTGLWLWTRRTFRRRNRVRPPGLPNASPA